MAPNTPAAGLTPAFSAAALALILEAEGVDQPGRWPGEASGITIGRGDDLGYQSAAEFADHWRALLPAADYIRLLGAIGYKGEAAHRLAPKFADIHISQTQADAVFRAKALPAYVAQTRKAFSGFDALPLDAQGALVSLIYNRGADMSGDRRTEMRAIRDEVSKPHPGLPAIADQFRRMKRLWVGKGVDGLLTRREAEACLVARAGWTA